jgi:hypothetical protein
VRRSTAGLGAGSKCSEEVFLAKRPAVTREAEEDLGEVTDLLLKRSRIALNEVYDVVCEGRIVGRIMLTNVPAPYWSWTLADRFHEGRTPTRGHESTIEAAMQAFAKSWRRE